MNQLFICIDLEHLLLNLQTSSVEKFYFVPGFITYKFWFLTMKFYQVTEGHIGRLVVVTTAYGNITILMMSFYTTRKYPLRGYILGVLTHTTALDRFWGGDGTLSMWF